MNPTPTSTRSRLGSLFTPIWVARSALTTAISAIVLFSIGGLVRGSGSGLGCSTWPKCTDGSFLPSPTLHSVIESSHRFLVIITSIFVVTTLILAWRSRGTSRTLRTTAIAALPLIVAQAVLGGIVVNTELNPGWVTVHFIVAMIFVADIIFTATRARLEVRIPDLRAVAAPVWVLTAIFAVSTGALLVVGTWVRASSAGLAFSDWPLMDGKLVPTLGGTATAMFAHRVLAAGVFLLALWTLIRTRVGEGIPRQVKLLATGIFLLFIAQVLVGAAQVWTLLKPWAVITHVALSVLIWAGVISMATLSRHLGSDSSTQPGDALDVPVRDVETDVASTTLGQKVNAYFQLTKPRIIVLLLITTIPAMILAGHAMPPLWLMLATLLGGTVAAGSANAINMYLDRDIDQLMGRTQNRPLPAHTVSPENALGFGFILGAASFFFLSITVNVMAASLSLSAIAFYVFVYTAWLKRSTAQNIVIGGAAGAVPALVGWAAVTGGLAAPAWVLFAIIFVWTPPHFWALATRFSGDYAAAGVPMLPVVKGEAETRRQILLYSLALFGVTILFVPIGHMGPFYMVSAVALGGYFIWRALVFWRTGEQDMSWKLFKYSIYYLAALFGAVAVDALVVASPR